MQTTQVTSTQITVVAVHGTENLRRARSPCNNLWIRSVCSDRPHFIAVELQYTFLSCGTLVTDRPTVISDHVLCLDPATDVELINKMPFGLKCQHVNSWVQPLKTAGVLLTPHTWKAKPSWAKVCSWPRRDSGHVYWESKWLKQCSAKCGKK